MFSILVDSHALVDIQEAYDYYEGIQIGLGNRFLDILEQHFSSLTINPYYQVRYDNIHCLPMNQFPYMIHFTIDENIKKVIVRAVLNTSKSPDEWEKRNP